jgi:hypothetical protein
VQIERLPVFFKQRDNFFFPAWTFVIPTTLMRLPVSFVESLLWTVITYFEIDLAPTAGRYTHLHQVLSTVRACAGMCLSVYVFVCCLCLRYAALCYVLAPQVTVLCLLCGVFCTP